MGSMDRVLVAKYDGGYLASYFSAAGEAAGYPVEAAVRREGASLNTWLVRAAATASLGIESVRRRLLGHNQTSRQWLGALTPSRHIQRELLAGPLTETTIC